MGRPVSALVLARFAPVMKTHHAAVLEGDRGSGQAGGEFFHPLHRDVLVGGQRQLDLALTPGARELAGDRLRAAVGISRVQPEAGEAEGSPAAVVGSRPQVLGGPVRYRGHRSAAPSRRARRARSRPARPQTTAPCRGHAAGRRAPGSATRPGGRGAAP